MTLFERLAAFFSKGNEKPKTDAMTQAENPVVVEEQTVNGGKIELTGRNMNYEDLLKINGGLPYWWKWQNFTPQEVACKCSRCGGELWQGESTVPPDWFIEAMDNLQRLRNQWGKPIVINSGHRCKEHNAEVGGVANSQHYTHIAFDCKCPKQDQARFVYIAQNAGFKYYKNYDTFVHLDMRVGK